MCGENDFICLHASDSDNVFVAHSARLTAKIMSPRRSLAVVGRSLAHDELNRPYPRYTCVLRALDGKDDPVRGGIVGASLARSADLRRDRIFCKAVIKGVSGSYVFGAFVQLIRLPNVGQCLAVHVTRLPIDSATPVFTRRTG